MIIVDRIEGKVAVCEIDGRLINIPIKLIRGKLRDGVILAEKDGAYVVDEETTKKTSQEIKDSISGLFDG